MAAPWDRRSRAEQRRVEGLVLGSWLPQALAYAPYWAAVAERLALDPQDLEDRDDLRRIPARRQADIASAGGEGAPGLLMRPTESQVKARSDSSTLWRILRSVRSEGAAGKRRALLAEFKPIHVHLAGVHDQLAIASSRSDLDRMHRAGARAAAVLGLDDADYLVSAVPPGPRLDWWGVRHLGLGTSMLALQPRAGGWDPNGGDLDEVVPAFGLVPATAVAVRPEDAVELAAVLHDADADIARVRTVVTVGLPPSDELREEIAEAWRAAGTEDGLRVRALWGAAGGRHLWAECAEGTTGLHTYPDLEVLEVLDPITADPTEGDGDLTLTTAGWHGTALLRYRTGAWTDVLTTDPCSACGRTVPRLAGEIVPEAWQPELAIGDQLVRLDLRGVAIELSTTEGARTWRTEVQGPARRGGDERLYVQLGGDVPEEQRQVLADRIERSCGVRPSAVDVTSDVEAVDRAAAEAGSVFADVR